jgi:hypothetical protein
MWQQQPAAVFFPIWCNDDQLDCHVSSSVFVTVHAAARPVELVFWKYLARPGGPGSQRWRPTTSNIHPTFESLFLSLPSFFLALLNLGPSIDRRRLAVGRGYYSRLQLFPIQLSLQASTNRDPLLTANHTATVADRPFPLVAVLQVPIIWAIALSVERVRVSFFVRKNSVRPEESLRNCSFGWWLMAGTGLFWEKNTAGWLLMAALF